MPTPALILIRAIHFAACLLIVGTWAFDRLIAAAVIGPLPTLLLPWQRFLRALLWILLPAALISGAFWLALVAANMSGQSLLEAIGSAALPTVWNRTTFGIVWQWHLACWCATAVFSIAALLGKMPPAARSVFAWLALFASAAFAGSLAGAGHGLVGPITHRLADILHLIAAGFWPAGLFPLFALFRIARRLPAPDQSWFFQALTIRFSTMSLIVVTLLTATGIINTWFLVGSIPALASTSYGGFLLLKVLLFLITVALGAANLLRWRPRLAAPQKNSDGSMDTNIIQTHIRFNVALELFLATLIILLVAVLGLLPFPNL